MGLFSKLSSRLSRSVDTRTTRLVDDMPDVKKTVANDLQAGTKRYSDRAVKVYGTRTGLGIAGAGAAGAGAWGYTQYAKTQRAEANAERYSEYQSRVADIERRFENGEITRPEYERLMEEAQEDFRTSSGVPGAGMNLYGFLSDLGTFQLLALSLVIATVSYWVIRPALRSYGGWD